MPYAGRDFNGQAIPGIPRVFCLRIRVRALWGKCQQVIGIGRTKGRMSTLMQEFMRNTEKRYGLEENALDT